MNPEDWKRILDYPDNYGKDQGGEAMTPERLEWIGRQTGFDDSTEIVDELLAHVDTLQARVKTLKEALEIAAEWPHDFGDCLLDCGINAERGCNQGGCMTKDELWSDWKRRRQSDRKAHRDSILFWLKDGGFYLEKENEDNDYRMARIAKWIGKTTRSVRRCTAVNEFGPRCTSVLGHADRWHSSNGFLNWTTKEGKEP